MAETRFAAAVNDWTRATKERMEAVRNMSIERIVEAAQLMAPVDTGFLRASVVGTLGSPPPATFKPDGEGRYAFDPGPVFAVIAGAQFSDAITIAWTANYARFVEYGARGRPARRFVGMAVQQWPQIVAQAAAELQGNVQGRQAIAVYQGGAL